MPPKVFISYDHDDANQVNGFRGLAANPNHPLELVDGSLPEPVRNRAGQIIRYLPTTRAPRRSGKGSGPASISARGWWS